jgi:hypothetical protein
MVSDVKINPLDAKTMTELIANTDSIQFQFAALQMQLAQSNKEKATTYLNDITKSQQEVKECAAMIAKARELQNRLKDQSLYKLSPGEYLSLKPSERERKLKELEEKSGHVMPADMVKYFKDHKLSYDQTGNDNQHNNDEWDYNIKSLMNYQENLSNSTQQQMVYIQDFMGQYNSYLTGANSCLQQSSQLLSQIARG